MRVTIFHHDEPIGTSDLAIEPPFVTGTLEPLPAFEALRPVFRDEWRATQNLGFLPPDESTVGGIDAAGDAAGAAAVSRAEQICRELELRADDGTVIVVESLTIARWADEGEVVINGFVSDDGEGVGAHGERQPRGGSAVSP